CSTRWGTCRRKRTPRAPSPWFGHSSACAEGASLAEQCRQHLRPELALVEDVDDAGSGQREGQRREEPADGGEGEVVGAQTVVEGLGRHADDMPGAIGKGLAREALLDELLRL